MGLAYNRFRYYDPKMGIYISQDPIGLLGGMVLYGYVGDVFGLAKRLPVSEFEIGGYEKIKFGVVGDGLSSHELLQSIWLQTNHKVTRTSDIGKLNPSIALVEPNTNKNISNLQTYYGLKAQKVKGQSALQNINRNIALTRRGIYEGLLERGWEPVNAKRYATELSMKLRADAIDFAKQNGYIKTNTH
ncbi:RHS repeat-associated core domain-containing protein [Myroides marinus]|uniref:RHS repeat-associated core domain-containing protein n=1 Tax=Myroides marinus TaxID=703342 RepID=UPI0025755DD2|nr:RHS repeat-associated core domain-containing protein [Myroides marinus]